MALALDSIAWLHSHTAKKLNKNKKKTEQELVQYHFGVNTVIWKPHEYCMLLKQTFPFCRQEENSGPLLKDSCFFSPLYFFFFLYLFLYHNCLWFLHKMHKGFGM